MESKNFEILRNKWPELATLGGFAEQYAYPDPASALIKLRTFAEQLVEGIYRTHDLLLPYSKNLFDLLGEDSFKNVVPKVVLEKLHLIRTDGNKAAHGGKPDAATALAALRESFDLGRWLFVSYGNGTVEQCPTYQPPPPEDTKATIKKEKKAALEKLAAQEIQLQTLLSELEATRAEAKEAKKSAAELQAFIASSKVAVDVLKFDEATTRQRLIDKLLVEAGWNVAPNGGNTDEVGQEIDVEHQPTSTGMGRIDYVLWDDNGLPLAVIEAKKTSESPEKGRTQAKLYADGLEKMHQQRPAIFYTNGFDIFLWDDAQNYPPRRLHGFYSKDSLQYLVTFQRQQKKPLASIEPRKDIADRLYQVEALKRVGERFTSQHRNALIVQATGTGKTRVAISLTDILIRANWVKRVLFICDRLELRKQAKNVYNDFLNEPLTLVTARTAKDRNKRIYLATYPAMMKIFQTFDVGFFDLIIADESHRSIYNRYGDLFKWFDCLQVGLTATPVDKINRNTYRLFDCEQKMPTVYYPFEKAVEEGHLAPYEVFTHTTEFLRAGIKFNQLTEEQIKQLEEDDENPALFNYTPQEIDKKIFNKETNREILRNLMENGIRNETSQVVGKSIIFARNHNHAVLLSQVFDEMYPQYGGNFCQVIDTYDTRAEQLIDDFKDPANPLTIAVSVDMLDTGIDVPEIVNLVFAKPIFSWVKFWQMIGRGTRLCKGLFGPSKDKERFRIFDHWGNFERFEIDRPEADPAPSKSIMQLIFETRLSLAETAMNKAELDTFRQTVELVRADLNSLPEESIAVREHWREKRTITATGVLDQFAPTTVASLRNDMAPLMQWINTRDHADAYQFDLLVSQAQIELLKDSGRFIDFKDQIQDQVAQLLMHLNPVQAKAAHIKKVQSNTFWDSVTLADLEKLRVELRGIMHHRHKSTNPKVVPKTIDIADGEVRFEQRSTNVRSMDKMLYTKLVEETLQQLFDTDPTLRKIRRGEPVTRKDLEKLTSLVLTQHPNVNLELLKEFYPDTAPSLDFIIRTIVGMEPEAVEERFATFARRYPAEAKQTHFLRLLKNHIAKFGTIAVERLYEDPFTSIDSDGLDGVFPHEEQIDEIVNIIETFSPAGPGLDA